MTDESEAVGAAGTGRGFTAYVTDSTMRRTPLRVVFADDYEKAAAEIARLSAVVTALVEALQYARPVVQKYAHTQGDSADFHAEIVAPIDAALSRAVEAASHD